MVSMRMCLAVAAALAAVSCAAQPLPRGLPQAARDERPGEGGGEGCGRCAPGATTLDPQALLLCSPLPGPNREGGDEAEARGAARRLCPAQRQG